MSDVADGGATSAMAEFRALVDSADRKFALVRDLPAHGAASSSATSAAVLHAYRKAFKAYTRLWRFQQERRSELVAGGLHRWEIGEIASRIGQLYYAQYQRTSEARFLLESYVFYEAILSRGYFEAGRGAGKHELGLRLKELRFHARFIVVAMLLNRVEAVKELAERFNKLVEDSKTTFPETNFREWKLVLQEIVRFLKVDTGFKSDRPLRYSLLFDCHLSSLPHIARFEPKAKRVLKLQDALLTSYHRNEVKFTELTLDTFRMLQCLEWEPSGSFYQKPTTEKNENGAFSDQSGASGLIDINLAADMTDPTLPPNPQKAVLYRPSVPHIIAVLAMICEELSSDSILLIYLSASGKVVQNAAFQKDNIGTSSNFLKLNPTSQTYGKRDGSFYPPPGTDKSDSSDSLGNYLLFGSRGSGGFSNLYPEDLIPFTRRPLFIIVDSDNSYAFKAVHGAERGETAALLLSPEKPSSLSAADPTSNGSQFTFFLTAPLHAFCELVGVSTDINVDECNKAETILSTALSEWEVILCTSDTLDQVWAQVLSDSFLRRLILRFIYCRAVFSLFCPLDKDREYLPECLPNLPESVSPDSAAVQSHVFLLAECLGVVGYFHFSDTIRNLVHNR